MSYSVFLRPAAARDLQALAGRLRQRVEAAIDQLGDNPRGRNTKKLAGFANEWRLRVGDYRVLYLIDDSSKQVTIARVAHRREAYR